MIRRAIPVLMAAGLAAGACNANDSPETALNLELTIVQEIYPYDPAEAGPKGSGDLGQASEPLAAGEVIVAECVQRPESGDKRADAARIASGQFAGMVVSLQTYGPVEGLEQAYFEAVPTFNRTPVEIREQLDYC